MASTSKLELLKSPALSDLFKVKKGFLGIGTKITYLPTVCSATASTYEYSLADGEQLERIFRMSREQMVEKMKDSNLETHGMGNARLEVVKSDDGACLAMQLFRFIDFNFAPVTDAVIFEGAEAEAVGKVY